MKKNSILSISIGIAAYNEEANIGRLLDSIKKQRLKKVKISEILIISSGSTDKTNSIVKKYSLNNKKINLIRQAKRLGKASAVNLIISLAKNEIIVLMGADILLSNYALERLVNPLSNKNVGLVGSRPIPLNDKSTFFGYTAHLLWDLHHKISLTTPKMGECIAFRKVFRQIPTLSSVDEANIEPLIRGQGFKSIYEPRAVIYNLGAQTLEDYVARRRHIYAGHLATMHEYSYAVSTISGTKILFMLLKNIELNWRFILWTPAVIILEIYCRLLGYIDYKIKRKSHTVWQITKSTKKLPITTVLKKSPRSSLNLAK